MPGFDGTGPTGKGPLTGGGDGYCVLKLGAGPGESSRGPAAELEDRIREIGFQVRLLRGRVEYLEDRKRPAAGGETPKGEMRDGKSGN
ncbi:MAG TPA: DUF5320 domain-containing protein [bacterium]|nr:DUF5320 domain-containing protein [bacterium]HPJ72573.1 DUF5320 domain-containing protein [bacterium]HPQ66411.1 DUF5320 domain-containing protein [bacterium]